MLFVEAAIWCYLRAVRNSLDRWRPVSEQLRRRTTDVKQISMGPASFKCFKSNLFLSQKSLVQQSLMELQCEFQVSLRLSASKMPIPKHQSTGGEQSWQHRALDLTLTGWQSVLRACAWGGSSNFRSYAVQTLKPAGHL